MKILLAEFNCGHIVSSFIRSKCSVSCSSLLTISDDCRAACALGYPITLPLDLFQRKLELSGLMSLAPRSLNLEVKLASIVGRMNSVLFEFNFDDLQDKPQVAPSMILDVFEVQLNDLERESVELSGMYCTKRHSS